MIAKFVFSLLALSLSLSPLLLLFLLCAPRLGKRYVPVLSGWICLVFALRLLLPLPGLPGVIRLPAVESAPQPTAHAELPTVSDSYSLPAQNTGNSLPDTSHGIVTPPEAHRENGSAPSPHEILACFWAAGFCAVIVLRSIGCYRSRRRLRRWSRPAKDSTLLSLLEEEKSRLSITQKIALRTSLRGDGPLLVGFFSPTIVLPEKTDAASLPLLLRHELTHLRRKDLWRKLLFAAAATLHWFNPLAWLLARQADLQIELCCDAETLRCSGDGERLDYAATLLTHMEQASVPLATTFAGSKKDVKRRFHQVLDAAIPKKKGIIPLLLALTLVIGFGSAVGYAAAETAQNRGKNYGDMAALFRTFEAGGESYSVEGSQPPVDLQSVEYTMLGSSGAVWGGRAVPAIVFTSKADDTFPVSAVAPGRVTATERDNPTGGYGNYVIVNHGGSLYSLYACLATVEVEEGDEVRTGALLGSAGKQTAADNALLDEDSWFLHFELRYLSTSTPPEVFAEWEPNFPAPVLLDTTPRIDPIQPEIGQEFLAPVEGGYVSCHVNGYPGHAGADIAGLPEGTPVYASAAGTVTKAVNGYTGYGKHLMIDHGNGITTLYGHCNSIDVQVGDYVEQGDQIATLGDSGMTTGLMLHFEMRQNGSVMDPLDYVDIPKDRVR
ncbi:MAG: peptidoglycan DD-metalloendopeptidase family protein [Oscillospiraceae bacterium]